MDPITTMLEGALLRFGADVAGEALPLGKALLQVVRWQHELDQAPADDPRRRVLEGNVRTAQEVVLEHYARIEGMLDGATGQPIFAAALGALAAVKNELGGGEA